MDPWLIIRVPYHGIAAGSFILKSLRLNQKLPDRENEEVGGEERGIATDRYPHIILSTN